MSKTSKSHQIKPAKQYHHGDLPAALLEQATRVIEADGVDAVSVRSLARDIGVAHGAAYRHFPDKAALLASVYAAAYHRLADRQREMLTDATTPQEALFRIGEVYVDFAFDEPQMALAMAGRRINEDGEFPALETAIARAFHPVVKAVKDGRRAGVFHTSTDTAGAALFFSGLQGVVAQALLRRLKLAENKRRPFFRETIGRLIAALEYDPGE